MKFFPSSLFFGLFTTSGFALESAEITALSAKFTSPSGDEQYKARIELAQFVDQATLPGKGDPAAVSKLLGSAIQSPDTPPEAKKYLLRNLARVGTSDAVAAITPMLDDTNPMLKDEARCALQSIPDPQALAALQGALGKATDSRSKSALIDALSVQKSSTSIPLLAPLVSEADQEVASAAMLALSRIGGSDAVAVLNKALASDVLAPSRRTDFERAMLDTVNADFQSVMRVYDATLSETNKITAFLALMKTAPENAKPAIIEGALKSENAGLRQQAIVAAIRSQLPSFTSTLSSNIAQMPKGDRLIVLANIHLLKPIAAAEKIALTQMESKEGDEQVQALVALGRIATKPAFDGVLKALAAPQPQVNQAASTALADMNFPAAESTLLALLNGPSSPEKIFAIKAMLYCRVTDAGNVLMALIKGSDQGAAKESMKTLYFIATLDDLRALSALAIVTQDSSLKNSLAGLSSKIAARLNTDEAREILKSLN
ncbi:MAG: HEAT repeat domain-containing protein [Gloeobacteraceae cyanobacterium ES-bin-144]|nr:HEAT repeat domain-containing protein [Verrucomicrobiales bacterium]